MSLTAPEIRHMARGSTHAIEIDWGRNTAGEETGVLKAGDTVVSCEVAVLARPAGSEPADDPTLGSVTAPSGESIINGETCAEGEWTRCTIQTAADQAYGTYKLLFTATTDDGWVLPRSINVIVGAN